MRILLLTENPVLALGLEAALFRAHHSGLLLCSTNAQLREQLAARRSSPAKGTAAYTAKVPNLGSSDGNH